ncbi:MAG: alpha/beta hydrolase [Candidatus Nanopelagicales bacterium]
MRSLIVLPGIWDSGPAHWQTLWEVADPAIVRFSPPDWDRPVRAEWIAALEAAVVAAPEPPVLVAHSLSCLLVPMWAAVSVSPVAGAFLVAPVDPAAQAFPEAAVGFGDVPRKPLRCPSLVVGSLNDPYADVKFSRELAADLGAQFVVAGALGHINADSGLGDWPQGQELLAGFVGRLGRDA